MPSPKRAVKARPTETLSGLGLAAAVYGFLTQAGVGTALAAVLSVVVAFAPAVVSVIVDAVRREPPRMAVMESSRPHRRRT